MRAGGALCGGGPAAQQVITSRGQPGVEGGGLGEVEAVHQGAGPFRKFGEYD
jgi:hypothetical protein